jgi:hypothetical protein
MMPALWRSTSVTPAASAPSSTTVTTGFRDRWLRRR